MVGRATWGNPWLLKEISDAFNGVKADMAMKDRLTFQEKIPFILDHCEIAIRHKGELRGMLEMRRHFASYVKGFEGAATMRTALMKVETFAQAKETLLS
jgi:tRNA-dihydrouridine synthase B